MRRGPLRLCGTKQNLWKTNRNSCVGRVLGIPGPPRNPPKLCWTVLIMCWNCVGFVLVRTNTKPTQFQHIINTVQHSFGGFRGGPGTPRTRPTQVFPMVFHRFCFVPQSRKGPRLKIPSSPKDFHRFWLRAAKSQRATSQNTRFS